MNHAFININYRNGQACPVFRCASCGDWINVVRDEEGGLILWDGDRAPEGWYEGPSFAVHKGRCLDRFEAVCEKRKRFIWRDISDFLADLLSNAGYELSAGVESIDDGALGTLFPGMPKKKRRAEKAE